MTGRDPAIREHYDALAEDWGEFVQEPWKADVAWPATRALLPDLSGERVLDVGCADGYYAAWLADQGADVLGVDLSEEMVRAARDEYGDRASFRQGDVSDSLAFVDDDAFDVVLCQDVLSHLPSVEPALAEFARVLRPGGTAVVSTHHPLFYYLVVREETYPNADEFDNLDADPVVRPESPEVTYGETERFEIYWGGDEDGRPATYYRRPFCEILGPLLEAGFDLRDVAEPGPGSADVPDLDPELARRPPMSLCLRAERRN